MPSIRKRVYGLIRTLSSPNQSGEEEGGGSGGSSPDTPSPHSPSCPPPDQPNSFIYLYLTGRLKRHNYPEIYYGKTGCDLPGLFIEPLTVPARAAHSGPEGGLTNVPAVKKQPIANIANLDDELSISFDTESICSQSQETKGILSEHPELSTSITTDFTSLPPGLQHSYYERHDTPYNWESPDKRAYGASTSLYECHPITHVHAGHPVADVFGIVARDNNCIMALADGVNWGDRARLAARCAIRGALDHINENLFDSGAPTVTNTQEIFHVLLGAFHAGHQLILQESGMLTTLCVTVICKLRDTSDWVVCACNVGDSLCFVFNRDRGVREVTLGSHDIAEMRDMRDALGALGPVDGVNPELQNLTCSMTVVQEGDIVFITSDGISDNFDPVVGKFCVIKDKENIRSPTMEEKRRSAALEVNGPKMPAQRKTSSPPDIGQIPNGRPPLSPRPVEMGLPAVEAYQRHELMLLRMDDLLRHGVTLGDAASHSAQELCDNLINFATQLTVAKRRVLEDIDLYQGDPKLTRMDQRQRRRLVRQKISEMPGKLDHATVVAFTVGMWPKEEGEKLADSQESMDILSVQVDEKRENGVVEDPELTPKPRRKLVNGNYENGEHKETEEELEDDSSVLIVQESSPIRFSLPDAESLETEREITQESQDAPQMSTTTEKRDSDAMNFENENSGTNPDEIVDILVEESSSDPSKTVPTLNLSVVEPTGDPVPSPCFDPSSEGLNMENWDSCVKMIDESSQSSSISSGLQDGAHSFSETMVSSIKEEASYHQDYGIPDSSEHNVNDLSDGQGPISEDADSPSRLLSTIPETHEESDHTSIVSKTIADTNLASQSSDATFVLRTPDFSNAVATVSLKAGQRTMSSGEPEDSSTGHAISELSVALPPQNGTRETDADSFRDFELLSPVNDSVFSSEPSPNSELGPDMGLVSDLEQLSPDLSNDSDVSVSADMEACQLNVGSVQTVFANQGAIFECSTLNHSYYVATQDCSVLPSAVHKSLVTTSSKSLVGGKPPLNPMHSPKNGPSEASSNTLLVQPKTKKKKLTKTFERIENTLKRRKHKRGSPTRHTVAVDGSWLRKLSMGWRERMSSQSSIGGGSSSRAQSRMDTRDTTPCVEETGKSGSKSRLPSISGVKNRLRGLGSPLKMTSGSASSSVTDVTKTGKVKPGKGAGEGFGKPASFLVGSTEDRERLNGSEPPLSGRSLPTENSEESPRTPKSSPAQRDSLTSEMTLTQTPRVLVQQTIANKLSVSANVQCSPMSHSLSDTQISLRRPSNLKLEEGRRKK